MEADTSIKLLQNPFLEDSENFLCYSSGNVNEWKNDKTEIGVSSDLKIAIENDI